MADSADSGRVSPLPKPPAYNHQWTPTPPHPHRPMQIPESPPTSSPTPKKPKPRRNRSCRCVGCMFCVWMLAIFCFILFLFAVVGAFICYVRLHPKVPTFRVERLNVTRLDLTTNSELTFLNTNVDLSFEAWNQNNEIGFVYDHVKVRVMSENVNLGNAFVPKFSQVENNMTILRIHAGVSNSLVDDGIGKVLVKKFKDDGLVLNVELRCVVDVIVGNWHTGGFPIKLVCNEIHLSRVAAGFEPKCGVRMFGCLEEKLKDLQIGNNTLVQKGAILEEKVKHLEVSKESLTIAEISIKEMIGRLNEVNAGFQTQVKELEESRNNIVQENKQLMESISVMDLRIQRLEKDATFHGSSTVTMTKHFPVEESLEETHALVDKLDAENSKLFEKVNDLYIERDRNTIVVNHPSTTELSPATTPARLAVSMDFVSENGEKMSESIEKLGYVASIYETIHIDNDDANSSADTGVQPQEQPESDEARGSLEIVQVPLDENQIVAEDSQAINVDENSGVPISDAPLIGAPFRLISFFAKYVSGADLVNKNSPNSG